MERLTVILFIALIVIIAYNIIEIFLANKLYKKIEKEHQEEIDKLIDETIAKITKTKDNAEEKEVKGLKWKKRRVRKDFLYVDMNGARDLAGKEFNVDFEVTPDEVDEKARMGNPACLNFCTRRMDFTDEFNKKLYYGHIIDDDGFELGYVLCEDELD